MSSPVGMYSVISAWLCYSIDWLLDDADTVRRKGVCRTSVYRERARSAALLSIYHGRSGFMSTPFMIRLPTAMTMRALGLGLGRMAMRMREYA